MTKSGIPVMGHLGLTPQSVNKIGGYKIQGKEEKDVSRLLEDAENLEKVGVFSIVLEMVVSNVSKLITEHVNVPTIGIGSGPYCDGQVLVVTDMLGMNPDFNPKFLKKYADLYGVSKRAIGEYISDVKGLKYPGESNSF